MTQDLNGLILAGGQSARMGEDKSLIQYRNEPQVVYVYKLLQGLVSNTYVSVRKGQKVSFTDLVIEDAFDVHGPLNGLLSAHQFDRSKAWMVLAVDLPFISSSTVDRLIQERDQTMMATALVGAEKGLPEPLIAIWEPPALEVLEKYHLNGKDVFPSRFLNENQIKRVKSINEEELFNVNDKVDLEQAKSMIDKRLRQLLASLRINQKQLK